MTTAPCSQAIAAAAVADALCVEQEESLNSLIELLTVRPLIVLVGVVSLHGEVAGELSASPEGAAGAVVSTTMDLLFPREFAAPGEASVNVALLPAASLIVPLLRARALTDV